jgi:hypothetical protein
MCVNWAMKNGGLTLWSVLGGIPAPLGPRRLTGQRSGRASTRIACGGGGQGGPSGPTVESSNSPMVPKWLKYPPHHGWYMLIYVDIVGEGMIRYEADVFWFIFRASGSRGGHRELAKRLVGQAGWVSFADHGRFSPKWWPLWPFKNSETCWKLMIYYRTFLPQHVQVPNLRRKKSKMTSETLEDFQNILLLKWTKRWTNMDFNVS